MVVFGLLIKLTIALVVGLLGLTDISAIKMKQLVIVAKRQNLHLIAQMTLQQTCFARTIIHNLQINMMLAFDQQPMNVVQVITRT